MLQEIDDLNDTLSICLITLNESTFRQDFQGSISVFIVIRKQL